MPLASCVARDADPGAPGDPSDRRRLRAGQAREAADLGSLGLGRLVPAAARRQPPVAARRARFSLLIVRGDGERVLRINFPRRAALWATAAVVAAVSATGILFGDWMKLRELTREAVTFQAQIQEQRTTINTFNTRVAELRQEVSGWREVHAQDLGAARSGAGAYRSRSRHRRRHDVGGRDAGEAVAAGGAEQAGRLRQGADRQPARPREADGAGRQDAGCAADALAGAGRRQLGVRKPAVAVDGRARSSTMASTSGPSATRRSTRRPPPPSSTPARPRTTAPRSCSTTARTSAPSTATSRR